MMRSVVLSVSAFLLFVITLTATAQEKPTPEQRKVQQVIHQIFESFSERSIEKMEGSVTTDINILEDGKVWTLDTIRLYFQKRLPADFKRINSFEFLRTEVHQTMGFVSYYNTASIHSNNKDVTVKWLESAVLVKEQEAWKIKMLHSTRIQP
jgi:hypothetical protein